jgi:aspartyl-tRNA(Asn)/glutamyl-tRNA(Gln) amidotransferase subunit C
MKVTEQDVAYVAELADLELTDQERRRMLKDLNSILDYIDRLNELDTANVPPMAQVSSRFSSASPSEEPASILREDVPASGLSHEQALKNAPVTEGEFFKVPKVIER